MLCSELERAEECGAYHMNIIMPHNFFDHTDTALKEFRRPAGYPYAMAMEQFHGAHKDRVEAQSPPLRMTSTHSGRQLLSVPTHWILNPASQP